MPESVSFIIPVLNEQAGIGLLLQDLRQRYPDSELLVVDGGSNDGTVAAVIPHSAKLLLGPQGRAAQMNLGGRAASGDYLCFLHADSRPTVSADQLQAYLSGRAGWGFCRIRLSGRGYLLRVIESFMNVRSSLTRVATGDQMLWLHRDLFVSTGGFDSIPLMEDVAYCKRLRQQMSPQVISEAVITSSRRWEQRGVVRTVLAMWCLRLAYFLGVSPQRLWHYYYGR